MKTLSNWQKLKATYHMLSMSLHLHIAAKHLEAFNRASAKVASIEPSEVCVQLHILLKENEK